MLQGNKQAVSLKGWFEEILLGYWFLWAVLFFTVAVGLVCKLFSRRWWFLGCILFVPILLITPCRWVLVSTYPFYLAGFFYGAWRDERKLVFVRFKYIAIGLFAAGLVYYMSHTAVGNSEIKGLLDVGIGVLKKEAGLKELMLQGLRVLLYYYLGLFGSVTVIVSADRIVKKVSHRKVIKQLAELGKYSLQIYILQRVIVELILGKLCLGENGCVVKDVLVESIPMFTYVYSLLISILCAALIYVIAKYGIRGKLRNVLFGR